MKLIKKLAKSLALAVKMLNQANFEVVFAKEKTYQKEQLLENQTERLAKLEAQQLDLVKREANEKAAREQEQKEAEEAQRIAREAEQAAQNEGGGEG